MNESKEAEFNQAVLNAIGEINKKTSGELIFNMNRPVNRAFFGKRMSRTTVIEIRITENL